jgi:hypothetical protein
MFLMYVDESGDVGLKNSPTRYFVLSAIVVHELNWKKVLSNLVEFRINLRDTKGLKLREEIHSADFINKPKDLKRIKRNDRLDILKKCIDCINNQSELNVFNVVVDKKDKSDDIFDVAWNLLLKSFENSIKQGHFSGVKNKQDRGIVLSDNTEGEKLKELIRKMRHFNINQNIKEYSNDTTSSKLEYIIEDPILRDSQFSLLHQMNDVVAYCIRQRYEPNAYMKKKGGVNFYKRLTNVVVKQVSESNEFGIVEK